MRPRLKWVAAALGVAALVAGTIVLFATEHEARSAFLLTAGLALLLASLFAGRLQLEGFEVLGAKVRVREVVKRRLERAGSPEAGTGEDPAALRDQAAVLEKLEELYGLYGYIRRVEPPGNGRTRDLDEVADRMQEAGRGAVFDAAEVSGWFRDGTDELRVIALNLMLVNQEQRNFLVLVEAIDAPHSLFEQYYALRVANRMLPSLDSIQRRVLAAAVRRARGKRRLRRDEPLMTFSRNLLAKLDEPEPSPR